MTTGNNFVDLRINNVGLSGNNEDSVWPAFTDIMTVILMIFLISLVTFLIRNTQLVDELQTTLIEKDQLSERALLSAEQNNSLEAQLALVKARILSLEGSLESTSGEKDKLQKKLTLREQSVKDMELQVSLLIELRDQLSESNNDLLGELELGKFALKKSETQLNDTKNTLNEKISLLLADKAELTLAQDRGKAIITEAEEARVELNNELVSLTEQLRIINEKLEIQQTDNQSLNSELDNKSALMAGLSNSKEALEEKLQEMAKELSKLKNLYKSRGAVVSDLETLISGNQLKYKSLEEEYKTLDKKFRKLIRPARSTAGKYVVNVHFAKQNGQAIYKLKLPTQKKPQIMSFNALQVKLSELKSQHKLTLYTKVLIDDKSGIGFNEAWKFTNRILSEYDYYANDTSEINPSNINQQ